MNFCVSSNSVYIYMYMYTYVMYTYMYMYALVVNQIRPITLMITFWYMYLSITFLWFPHMDGHYSVHEPQHQTEYSDASESLFTLSTSYPIWNGTLQMETPLYSRKHVVDTCRNSHTTIFYVHVHTYRLYAIASLMPSTFASHMTSLPWPVQIRTSYVYSLPINFARLW